MSDWFSGLLIAIICGGMGFIAGQASISSDCQWLKSFRVQQTTYQCEVKK